MNVQISRFSFSSIAIFSLPQNKRERRRNQIWDKLNSSMNNEILQLENWKNLTDKGRLEAARALMKSLPSGFEFVGLETHAMGEQQHEVAFFDWNPTPLLNSDYLKGRFALIPGAEVVLGYDRENPFIPSAAQREDWQHTESEYEIDLHCYLDQCMTPLRPVNIKPFLIEQKIPKREKLVPISQESELKEILSEEYPAINSTEPDENFQIWWEEFSTKNPYIRQTIFPTEIVKSSRQFGFRSPTSDEWEYACAASSRTLWRWGNDCLTDAYPFQLADDESPHWNLNLVPNAFGLTIAFDDYSPELCEDGINRGGDGGSSTCGGAGYVSSWLTLASAFFGNYDGNKNYAAFLSTEPHDGSRRVFPLR